MNKIITNNFKIKTATNYNIFNVMQKLNNKCKKINKSCNIIRKWIKIFKKN